MVKRSSHPIIPILLGFMLFAVSNQATPKPGRRIRDAPVPAEESVKLVLDTPINLKYNAGLISYYNITKATKSYCTYTPPQLTTTPSSLYGERNLVVSSETDSFTYTQLYLTIQWNTFAQIVSFDTNKAEVVKVAGDTPSTKTSHANFFNAGQGSGSDSTTVTDVDALKSFSCANDLALKNLDKERASQLNGYIESDFLRDNLQEEQPSTKTVIVAEAVGTTLKIRVLKIDKDNGIEFVVEHSHSMASPGDLTFSGCSTDNYALADVEGTTTIYNHSKSVVSTLNGPSGGGIAPVAFLSNSQLLWMRKEAAGDSVFIFAHLATLTAADGTIIDSMTLPVASTNLYQSDGNGVFAVDGASPTSPVLAIFYIGIKNAESQLVRRKKTVTGVAGSQFYGIAKGIPYIVHNSGFELVYLNDNSMVNSEGTDSNRYEVTWFNERAFSKTPGAGKTNRVLLFSTAKMTSLLIGSSSDSGSTTMTLSRVLVSDFTAVCTLATKDLTDYANIIPVFFGETLPGRFGYRSSFSWLLVNDKGDDTFSKTEILFLTIYLGLVFVVVGGIGIWLMRKTSKKVKAKMV